ncbi:TPA: RidA family protein [Candidatus Gracilibacteria bacterium]|nr:RidA family protein [Candidatus Gracilibacteria bacterium]HIQ57317.1 RidA family protein [Candidatus Gracilibacteria bacterium]
MTTKITAIYPKNAAKPAAPYSPAVQAGNTFYFSGQVALTPNGEFKNETLDTELTQIFTNIEILLSAGNLTKKNIAKVTIYLKDLQDYNAVNIRYAEFLGDITPPARSCFEVAKLPLDAKVEIEIIAVI